MRTADAFPLGLPHQFSLECAYRTESEPVSAWHLLEVTNEHQESQLAVTMNPGRKTLEIGLPGLEGDLQIVEYHHSAVSFAGPFLEVGFHKRWMILAIRPTLAQDHAGSVE